MKERKMDIFTDASLNDRKKIAGISAVFVPAQTPKAITCYHSYCSVAKIETAELLAIAMALFLLKPQADKNIRIVSDSKGALRKIQRLFHHPDQRQIQTIKDAVQRKIMYNMSTSFAKMCNLYFSFWCIRGHQHKVQETSDAYYNAIADEEALIGRMGGENIQAQEKEHKTGVSTLSPEERVILNQTECLIVSPKQISFHYEEPKVPNATRRHPKNLFVRDFCKSARSH